MRVARILAVGIIGLVGIAVFLLWREGGRTTAQSLTPSARTDVGGETSAKPMPAPIDPAGPSFATASASRLSIVADKGRPFEEQVESLQKVSARELAPADVDALWSVVKDQQAHPTVRNDCVAKLLELPTPPTELGAALIEMFEAEEKTNQTWANYCLQWCDRAYPHSPDKARIEELLWRVAKAEHATRSQIDDLSGTALLALQRIGLAEPRIAEAVGAFARERVVDANPDTAVSALQVAREAGDKSQLSQARKLAADTSAAVRVRLSAIALVGQLGDASDQSLLASLVAESEKESRIRNAASVQLDNLKKR